LIFVLTSCNLPTGNKPQDASLIATKVALTMAAVVPSVTFTQPAAVDVSPTPTSENPAATFTVTATATATVTPTATTPPDDPKLTLGTPDFWFNSASSGDPFGVIGSPFNDSAVTITNQVGGLNFTSHAVNLGKRWRLSHPTPTDFYLEGTFKAVSCSGHDNYGLAMRMPTYDTTLGYFVGLSCDGSYIVDRIDKDGNGENLIEWTPDTHIQVGPGQVNRLGVMLVGDSFKIYVNGVKIREFTDGTITNKGHVGAYVSARDSSDFTVDLQELMEWDQ
jgi:hypothetical protein